MGMLNAVCTYIVLAYYLLLSQKEHPQNKHTVSQSALSVRTYELLKP